MKIIISFARELTLNAIDGLSQYYEIFELKLQTTKEVEHAEILNKIKMMKMDLDDELVEWDIARQEHEMTFDMLLPNFFRYSFIVLLFLVVENKSKEICEAAHNINSKLPSPPQPRHEIINEYKKYLTDKVGVTSICWDTIQSLNKIRNCIVHTSGKVKEFRYERYIRDLAKKVPGIIISGTHEELREDLKPLYLESDMLMLKPDYCKEIIKSVRTFFEELCDALSLPKFEIKHDAD
jgi:hypothetical protein